MKQSIKFVLTAAIVGIVVAAAGCDHLPFGAAASAVPAAEQSGTYEYRIGQGDKLNIYVWRNPDLSVVAVPVRPDGKVSSPLVQEIQAAGKTPQELAKEIEQALSAYVKDPVVTVTVMEFIGAVGENVRVSGEVKTPQALPYRRNMTLLDVMIAAGGFTEFAAGNRSTLVRNAGGKQQAYRVRLEDLLKDGDITANMELQPGDVIIVPESIL